ncbi:diguanylate cyclase domain-containing protein [Bacterioplanoides sp.]|uniref:diguanylate cyclase domain-containing protein n=1 Tax=Bacterioplanoides sp. TaxID=2066072 RepID=UPI003B00F049
MEQTTLSKQVKKRSTREFYFAIFCVVALTFGSIAADFEAFELLYEFTRVHESWDLDEILLFLFYAGIVSTLYSIRRVGDIKRLNKKVTHLAYYDTVTQLPNRSFAIDQLKQMLRTSKRKRTQVAVAFIDFDNFKTINDTFGHSQGDELLKQIGQRLSSELNDPGFVARLGGDEFLVLMQFSDHQALSQLDQLFSRASKRPYVLSSGEVSVTFSIGVALFPQDAATVPSLLKRQILPCITLSLAARGISPITTRKWESNPVSAINWKLG